MASLEVSRWGEIGVYIYINNIYINKYIYINKVSVDDLGLDNNIREK